MRVITRMIKKKMVTIARIKISMWVSIMREMRRSTIIRLSYRLWCLDKNFCLAHLPLVSFHVY